MILGIWRASFLIPLGSQNHRHEVVSCRSTITMSANEINLISMWFAMVVRSALAKNWLCFTLVWEWREDWVCKECLVTRICTYTWTSRWRLVWFNEVLFCEVKSYSKSFWVVVVNGKSLVFSHCVGWVWGGHLVSWCSSVWSCMISILHFQDLHFIKFVNLVFSYDFY